MDPVLFTGILLGTWTLLLLLSSERSRRIHEIKAEIQIEAEKASREQTDGEQPIEVR